MDGPAVTPARQFAAFAPLACSPPLAGSRAAPSQRAPGAARGLRARRAGGGPPFALAFAPLSRGKCGPSLSPAPPLARVLACPPLPVWRFRPGRPRRWPRLRGAVFNFPRPRPAAGGPRSGRASGAGPPTAAARIGNQFPVLRHGAMFPGHTALVGAGGGNDKWNLAPIQTDADPTDSTRANWWPPRRGSTGGL